MTTTTTPRKQSSVRTPSAHLRKALIPLFFLSLLFGALYHIVQHTLCNAPTALETNFAYLLALVGYLLLPLVAGLLVRRRKTLFAQRALLDGLTPSAKDDNSESTMDKIANLLGLPAMLPRGRLVADVDKAAPKASWKGEDCECAVCLGDVETAQISRTLPCGHTFHAGCVELWLVTGRRNCCPLCLGKVCAGRDEGMECR